jgi:hypothetical protein
VFYKADGQDDPLNEKMEFDINVLVQDAMRAGLKVFNQMLK